MSNDTTQDVIRGIVATLKQAIMAVFDAPGEEAESVLATRINSLLGADDGKVLLEWLKTNKPEDFSTHVKLLLTKARSKQALQAASQANAIITGGMSWMQIVTQIPQYAPILKPFFVDQLNALDQSNAENVLKIIPPVQQPVAAQPATAPAV